MRPCRRSSTAHYGPIEIARGSRQPTRDRRAGPIRPVAHRMDRALGAGRIHLRAARDPARRRRRSRGDSDPGAGGGRCVGAGLLGAHPVHHADVDGHHHGIRAGQRPADAASHPCRREMATVAKSGGGHRGPVCDGELVVQLGLQPGVQRGAGPRDRAAGPDRRLSRPGRGKRPRHRQHLGPGTERIGSAADGDRRVRCSPRSARSSRAAAPSLAASSRLRPRFSCGKASRRSSSKSWWSRP